MKIRIFITVFLVSLVGCKNVFQESAKTGTQEAILYQAKLKMNIRDYQAAIALLTGLDPAFLAQRPVQLIEASAYSGRCGLEFVSLLTDLGTVGSATMFSFLMKEYPGGTDAKINDCLLSEGILNGIGTYVQRISDENILMGLSSLTKVGIVLSRYADTDGDGVVDAGFDHCNTTTLPDSAIREVGTGVANAILSVTAVAASIASGTLTQITALCAVDPNLNVFCTNTDSTAYSQNEVDALRAILGSTDQGIGACPGGFLACICP